MVDGVSVKVTVGVEVDGVYVEVDVGVEVGSAEGLPVGVAVGTLDDKHHETRRR